MMSRRVRVEDYGLRIRIVIRPCAGKQPLHSQNTTMIMMGVRNEVRVRD